LRNLATSLINSREERIVTTLPKAKELRPFVERAITLSRKARKWGMTLPLGPYICGVRLRHSFIQAIFNEPHLLENVANTYARTAGVAALRRLFDELGERYKDRPAATREF